MCSKFRHLSPFFVWPAIAAAGLSLAGLRKKDRASPGIHSQSPKAGHFSCPILHPAVQTFVRTRAGAVEQAQNALRVQTGEFHCCQRSDFPNFVKVKPVLLYRNQDRQWTVYWLSDLSVLSNYKQVLIIPLSVTEGTLYGILQPTTEINYPLAYVYSKTSIFYPCFVSFWTA